MQGAQAEWESLGHSGLILYFQGGLVEALSFQAPEPQGTDL